MDFTSPLFSNLTVLSVCGILARSPTPAMWLSSLKNMSYLVDLSLSDALSMTSGDILHDVHLS